jgi:HK97 family phage prohead protease
VRIKTVPARIKATGSDTGADAAGLQPGQFTALVSVFGNEDLMGDVVLPGAFTQTLTDWAAKGDPIPVIWSHDWGDPFAHIGVTLTAAETDEGLLVTGQIEDLDTNPTAAQVYRLLKGRRVTQFSFAYDIVEGAWVENRDAGPWGGHYELRQLDLYEVGPCLVGANQETELLAAKAAGLARGVKEGRVLAQAHVDRLKDAHAAIGEVIAAADGTTPSAQPAATEPAKTAPDTDADLEARVVQLVAKALAEGAISTTTTTSSTGDATPDPRETPDEGAAKAAAASARLRTDLQLLELEATLTE